MCFFEGPHALHGFAPLAVCCWLARPHACLPPLMTPPSRTRHGLRLSPPQDEDEGDDDAYEEDVFESESVAASERPATAPPPLALQRLAVPPADDDDVDDDEEDRRMYSRCAPFVRMAVRPYQTTMAAGATRRTSLVGTGIMRGNATCRTRAPTKPAACGSLRRGGQRGGAAKGAGQHQPVLAVRHAVQMSHRRCRRYLGRPGPSLDPCAPPRTAPAGRLPSAARPRAASTRPRRCWRPRPAPPGGVPRRPLQGGS
jgi:hypothetical protein